MHSAENDAALSPRKGERVAVTGQGEFSGRKGVVTTAWQRDLFEVRLDGGDDIECGGEYLRPIPPGEGK